MSTPPQLSQQIEAERLIDDLWKKIGQDVEAIKPNKVNWKQQSLPLARIKKIMKSDEAVMAEIEREREIASQHSAAASTPGPASSTTAPLPKQPSLSSSNQRFMIAGEAPILLSKACEMMVKELTVRAWRHTEKNRRRTLQKQDVHAAVAESDVYDFLIDIVPRVALQPVGKQSISFLEQNVAMNAAAVAAAGIATPSAVDFHQMQYNMMMQQQQQAHVQAQAQQQAQQQVQQQQQQAQAHAQQQAQQQVQGSEVMSNQSDLQQHQMMMYMPQMQSHMPQVQATNQQQQPQQERSPTRNTNDSIDTRHIESSEQQ